MTSRRIAVLVSLVILALGLQFALVGSPVGPSTIARAAPAAALTIGVLQPVDSLNPYIGINEASYILYGLLYDYPFSYDQDGNLVSNLITSASCDAVCMNWTYTVRQGVTWSDGTNLTAADVSFTWNYDSQNLAYLWAYEPYFNQVVQCNAGNQGHCGAVLTGTDQVTLYFQRPFVAGETLFAPIVEQAQWSAVSPQAAETTFQNPNPIGTGPFIADPNLYTEWQNQLSPNVALHVYRNPNYHPVGSHVGPSAIQDIYIRIFSDASSLAFAVLGGTVQLAQMSTSGLQAVRGAPNVMTQASLQAVQTWNYIGISQIDTSAANSRLNPTRFDGNVRRAMAIATNKDSIVQQFYSGQGVRGDTLISPITPQYWYDPVAGGDNLTFDVAHANLLLNQSGYTIWSGGSFGNGYRMAASAINVSYQTACYQCLDPPNVTKSIPAGTALDFTVAVRPSSVYPEEYTTAQYLQAQYARIGIQLVIKVETTESALATDVYGGNVEMYIWYWSGDPDPNYLISMQSSWTLDGWNDNYWNNASYNHAYLRELGDLSPTQRASDVQTAEKIQYESAVYIIYIYPYGQWAMRTDLWQGWGNWTVHPYRQMNADWGANPLWFDLNCPTCAPGPSNQPPSVPVIGGPSSVTTQVGVNTTFTASASDPESTDWLNFTWDWGDGTATTTTNTTSSTTKTSTYGHVWSLPSGQAYHIYSVTVSVSDGYNPPVYSASSVQVNVTMPTNPGRLVGTVRDTLGNPISGAQVSTSPGGYVGLTATNGTYSIYVTAGSFSLTAAKALYSSQTKAAAVATGQTVTVDFVLTPNPGWIAGTVTSASGGPISGASILATSTGGMEVMGSTNASGAYNLTVSAGTYTVNASASGYLAQSSGSRSVTLGSTTTVDFTLSLDHGWLAGHITDGGGHPIASATVKVSTGATVAATALTDGAGAYNVTLPVGTYSLNVTATGYIGESQIGETVGSGTTTVVNFTLVPLPGRISGTVLGPGNVPISGATVVVSQSSGTGSVVLYSVATDGAGYYSQTLPAGTYIVTVSGTGYVSQNRTGIVVGPGQAVSVNFALVAQGSNASPLSLEIWATIGIVVAVAAAAVVLLLFRRRRKPAKSPPLESPP